MLATITALTSLIGLIVSLIFLGVQTRAMLNQVRIAVNLNGTSGLDQCLHSLREIYFKTADRLSSLLWLRRQPSVSAAQMCACGTEGRRGRRPVLRR